MASEAIIQSVDRIPDRLTKVCSSCGHPKALHRFSPHNRARDGLQSACKDCHRIAAYVRYHEGGGKERAAERRKQGVAQAARKQWDRENPLKVKVSRKTYRQTPRGRLHNGRTQALHRARTAASEEGRSRAARCVALYDAEIARLDKGFELRKEPKSGKPIGRPMLVRHPTVDTAEGPCISPKN